jgi:GNAT superfamily N-acetyltransferase
MIEIRAMRLGDIPGADPLLMAAYRNPKSFGPRLRRYLAIEPEGWLVAVEEGRIVGTAGITVMGSTAYVGLVGTDPAEQRRGIALSLMRRILEMTEERRCATVLLDASPSGRPMYEKLGFVAEDMVGVWTREPIASEPRLNSPAGHAIECCTEADGELARRGEVRRELGDFDAACWGDDRRRILASFIADDPSLVALTRDPYGELAGYAILQKDSGILGPWICREPECARALLAHCLSETKVFASTAYPPQANEASAHMLSLAGFVHSRSNTHMRLGKALDSSRRTLVYSQASFAMG